MYPARNLTDQVVRVQVELRPEIFRHVRHVPLVQLQRRIEHSEQGGRRDVRIVRIEVNVHHLLLLLPSCLDAKLVLLPNVAETRFSVPRITAEIFQMFVDHSDECFVASNAITRQRILPCAEAQLLKNPRTRPEERDDRHDDDDDNGAPRNGGTPDAEPRMRCNGDFVMMTG